MSNFVYTEEVTGEIVQIPVSLLHHHPDNPRKDLGDLSELTESIKAKGILQNLTVVPYEQDGEKGYLVVIGNRRLEAAKSAGLETLPCIIASMTHAEQVQTMLLENMQRTDLTVYEQAKGFQMMIDFGDDVDTVSEKTGFSKTTIRRRLKMAELDEEGLKEVSDRQISLLDFDRLAKIESLDERNRILKLMGTYEFNNAVERAFASQESQKKLPAMKAFLKKIQAKKITWSESYGGKYNRVAMERIYLNKWDGEAPALPENEKIFYLLDEQSASMYVEFFTAAKRAKPERRSKKEIEAEQAAREAADKLRESAAIHYKLRKDFVNTITVTAKNRPLLIYHMARALSYSIVHWVYSNRAETLASLYGITEKEYTDIGYNERFNKLSEIIKADESMIPRTLYCFLGDKETNWYFTISEYELKAGRLPSYSDNDSLNLIYDFLCAFGYEMSDEEISMKNGTSPYFRHESKDEADDEDDFGEEDLEEEDLEDEVDPEGEEDDDATDDDFDAEIKKRLENLLDGAEE